MASNTKPKYNTENLTTARLPKKYNSPTMAIVGTVITLGALFGGFTSPGLAIIGLLAMGCLMIDYRLLFVLLALYIAGGVALTFAGII